MRRLSFLVLCVSVALWCNPAVAQDEFSGTYTDAELAALDKALWTQNLTRTDLNFDKDFGKGYACFPIVREMMADPLSIGSTADRLVWNTNPSKVMLLGSDFFAAVGLTDDGHHVLGQEQAATNSSALGRARTCEDLATVLVQVLHQVVVLLPEPSQASLRNDLLPSVVWHSVDGIQTPEESLGEEPFRGSLDLWSPTLFTTATFHLDLMLTLQPQWPEGAALVAFPQEQPCVIDSRHGRICLGTPNDDTYTGDFAVLIDPGGNDTYRNCRIGAAYGKATPELGDGRVGYFVDLGGDDLYDCPEVDITLGAAVLGVAAFYDLGSGSDRYYAGSVSLGAAIGGVATFYDDGGSDHYSGKVYTQGAAGFGVAVMCDDSVGDAPLIPTDVETPDPIDLRAFDNDTYTAWSEAQGFARTRGVAICTNARGNEVYHAGGVYLHAPLFSDRYQSFSQGFAIGEREIDYAGGIALLADYAGNDRYLGDVYNQGVGYWYSAGFLYDGGGNDHYEMTQYGQGSGIHLAVGGLIDEAGSDCYIIHNGLGQGSSHDYAASLFMDRGGDDRYLGNTTCNGSAVTNSVGLFFDRGGNDIYAGKRRDAINYGGVARGFGSIGVFVDVIGEDEYLGQMADDMLWTHKQYGVGIDVGPSIVLPGIAALEAPAVKPAGFDTPSDNPVIPPVVTSEGLLTQEVFDELWELAIRWEVGDNRVIVPAARKKLVSFGEAVLPYVAAKMGDQDTGLALRAQIDVFKGVIGGVEVLTPPAAGTTTPPLPPAPPQIVAILAGQLNSGHEVRTRNALQIIAELKLTDMGGAIAPLLDDPDPALQRRAVSVIGLIGSHAADDRLLALLKPETDERLLKVVVETVTSLELPRFDLLRPLLDHPSFAVSNTLVRQLSSKITTYEGGLRQILHEQYLYAGVFGTAPTDRAARNALRAYTLADFVPTDDHLVLIDNLTAVSDAGLLLEIQRLTKHWRTKAVDDGTRGRLASIAERVKSALGSTDQVLDIVPPT